MSNNISSTITVTRKVKESLKTARTFTIGRWSFAVINTWKGDKCLECGMPIEPGKQVYRVHDLTTSDWVESVHPNCLGLFFKNRRV